MQKDESTSDIQKSLSALVLILLVFFGAAFVTSSFPQNILINQDSIIKFNGNILSFQNINTQGANITLNGNQYQANNQDIIALGGRNSVILTGNQLSFNDISYFNGKLTVPTRINHIILFEQGTLQVPNTFDFAEVSYNNNNITITNLKNAVYNIKSGNNDYNILLPNNQITYITDEKNIALYKLQNKNNNLEITLIGYYTNKEFTITIKEEEV